MAAVAVQHETTSAQLPCQDRSRTALHLLLTIIHHRSGLGVRSPRSHRDREILQHRWRLTQQDAHRALTTAGGYLPILFQTSRLHQCQTGHQGEPNSTALRLMRSCHHLRRREMIMHLDEHVEVMDWLIGPRDGYMRFICNRENDE